MQDHVRRVSALRGMRDGPDLDQVSDGYSSIGVNFSAGLVDPKQGGSLLAGGPPDLVAVERYARIVCASLLLWQWEGWILSLPLPVWGHACLCPLRARIRIQQKPPKHHASCGLALRGHRVQHDASRTSRSMRRAFYLHDYLVSMSRQEYAHQLYG